MRIKLKARLKKNNQIVEVIPSPDNYLIKESKGILFKDVSTGDLYSWNDFIPIQIKTAGAAMSVRSVEIPINCSISGMISSSNDKKLRT